MFTCNPIVRLDSHQFCICLAGFHEQKLQAPAQVCTKGGCSDPIMVCGQELCLHINHRKCHSAYRMNDQLTYPKHELCNM